MPAGAPRGPAAEPQFTVLSVKLGQLFADPILVEAPAYQRFFAWTAQEAERLLEGLLAELEAGEEQAGGADYFLGTMLFIERDASAARLPGWPLQGPARAFDVVDGLQRLTTLTILFCVLRDLDADAHVSPDDGLLTAIGAGQGRSARPRLSLQERDEDFLHAHARAAGATRVAPDPDTLSASEARILEVRDHFLESLAELDAQQRRRLTRFLLERCTVVLIATTGIDRAYRMFTVLNDAGKPLARKDILKAEMLGGLPQGAVPAATVAWNGMETRLGDSFEGLFSHLRVMHGRSASHHQRHPGDRRRAGRGRAVHRRHAGAGSGHLR